MTESKHEEWVEWKGGPRPVAGDTLVKIKFRNGTYGTLFACELSWEHLGFPSDIVAYKVVNDQ